MSENSADLNSIFNLSRANVLVVDDCSFSLQLTCQALLAFGVRTRYQCRSAAEAEEVLATEIIDLAIVDCDMPGKDGYDLVRELRASGKDPNAYAPVIMLASHTRRTRILAARDCGANFTIARPISPTVLLDRIVWVARSPRQFLIAPGYAGPDRRFRDEERELGDERRANRIAMLTAEAAKTQGSVA